mmetsp:Transcript_40844/g.83935  ORF Transcript_40844/g.83935 Transcript_40844/m.83935 type:complete len:438 (-) Transcript_40844:13-1326(-)
MKGFVVLVFVAGLVLASGRAPRAVLEASFKERIQEVLNSSATSAAEHLAMRLDSKPGHLFAGYEVEFGKSGPDRHVEWLHGCLDVVTSRDSIENCILRQLQALTALCDLQGLRYNEQVRKIAERHLVLLKEQKLALLGVNVQKVSGASILLVQKQPANSADVDASPAVQASALMALVRCGEAVGSKEHLNDAEAWFQGLNMIYAESVWNKSFTTFHRAAITWESLAVTALHIPKHSSFRDQLEEYIRDFEAFLRQAWEAHVDFWSFSSARALAVRWSSKGLRKQQRKLLKRWAQEHVDRFLGRSSGSGIKAGPEGVSEGILARIGGNRYTCGPLQGLASLAGILKDAELIQVVLQLMEKDILRYQLSESNPGPFRSAPPELFGAFFRDGEQMELEARQSLRVDDTAMCLIAISHLIETLQSIRGVNVDVPSSEQGEL